MGSCDFISGWAGGVFGVISGHPFDTIKVNQQNRGIGMIICTKDIFKTQGAKGFFRGMAFPLLAASTINSAYFGVYRVSLEKLMELRQGDKLFSFQKGSPHSGHLYMDTYIAGCVGGAAQLVLACPVDLIKIKLQTSSVLKQGALDVVIHILNTRGIKGLYQGLGLPCTTTSVDFGPYQTVNRDIPSSGVYMLGYEIISNWMQRIEIFSKSVDSSNSIVSGDTLRILIAGGLAGTLSWWSIIPLDVIKSRIQADNPLTPRYKGWLDCGRQVVSEHGWKGLMRGIVPVTIRAFPVNAFTFLGYEWTNALCQKMYPRHTCQT